MACAACILLLCIPGAAGLLLAKKSINFSICFAPLVSIALLELVAIAFSLLQISCSALVIALIAALISIVVGCLLSRFSKEEDDFFLPLNALLAGVAFSFVFAWLVFFRPLGYTSIIPGFDSVFHVNLIQTFIDSGSYSPIGASLYAGSACSPVNYGGGFYPAAWHLVCATVREATLVDPAIAINAVNCIFCSVCFAGGQVVLISRLVKVGRGELIVLAVVALLSTAYPWVQLVQGEQFPQIASFAMLPLACALFDIMLDQKAKEPTVVLCALCALLSLATLQTNVVFSLLIFVFFEACRYVLLRSEPGKAKRNCLLLVVIGVALWTAAFLSPFMEAVVSYEWESTNTFFSAFVKLGSLSLAASGSQLVLALLVLAGLAWIARNREYIWLTGPAAFCSIIYVVATSINGLPKQCLGGFWYTDPIRLSAQVSIFVFPLVACGMLWLIRALGQTLLSKSRYSSGLASGISLAVILVASLCLRIPGVNGGDTSFDTLWNSINKYRTEEYEPILSSTELEFAKEAKVITGEETLVLNVPDDGSSILYGQIDIDVYYKRTFDLEDENAESKTIREGLNSIATDEMVREAVKSTGAKYVMLLDADDSSGLFHTYGRDGRWAAFYSINENTPGFKLLLSKDDCRLYEILG